MLIPQIDPNSINTLVYDTYKRPTGVFLINKPRGITSHDVVDVARRALHTKRVGHAGALDPFAEGLLIILVGKYTQYTEALIAQDKSYLANVILGIQTTTQDPEGDIILQSQVDLAKLPSSAAMNVALLKQFSPSYEQSVPLFSSVKLNGEKLRVLARFAQTIEYLANDELRLTFAKVFKYNGTSSLEHVIKLPKKHVKINKLELLSTAAVTKLEVMGAEVVGQFSSLKFAVHCSKGTYIRQLAQDIGDSLDYPAFLYELTRDSIGVFGLEQALSLEALEALGSKYALSQ